MKYFFTGIFIFFILHSSLAQKKEYAFNIDPNYIESYYNNLIIRIVSVNRNNFLQLKDTKQQMRLRYRPNDYFNLGVGLNYKWFGLNIGTKIPWFSNDDDRYGETTNLGIQTYMYGRKFIFDFIAQKTKGYYLSISDYHDLTTIDPLIFYQRRDISTLNLGAGFHYVLNHERFSYKAAFKQNELQKKSAGSLILGAGFYLFKVDAGSAIVPREIDEQYFTDWRNFDNFNNYIANLSVGYAYSFVPRENWIISGSYSIELGVNQNIWKYEIERDDWQSKISWGNEFRISGGHYFSDFYIGASFVRHENYTSINMNSLNLLNGTNYTEFTISKRMDL